MQVPGMKITGERKSKDITAKYVKMIILQIVLSGERPGSSRLLLSANLRTTAGFTGFCPEVFYTAFSLISPPKRHAPYFSTVNTIKPGKLRRYTNYVINQNLN